MVCKVRSVSGKRQTRKWRHHGSAELLGMSSPFPNSPNPNFRSSSLKWSPLLRWNWQWVHTFRCQKICTLRFASLKRCDNLSDRRPKDKWLSDRLHRRPSSHRKRGSNSLYKKLLEIEKEVVHKVARGDKQYLTKSADRNAQISKVFAPLSRLINSYILWWLLLCPLSFRFPFFSSSKMSRVISRSMRLRSWSSRSSEIKGWTCWSTMLVLIHTAPRSTRCRRRLSLTRWPPMWPDQWWSPRFEERSFC